MKVRKLIQKITNLLHKNQRGGTERGMELKAAPYVLRYCGEGLSLLSPPSYQANANVPSLQDYVPQKSLESHNENQQLDKITQLPSIYSGIGLGVYQGEVVVFLQMAIGEKCWLVSKLRFEDLSLFPLSIQSQICLLLCLLRLNNRQSDLVKMGLQTKGGIELMRSYCPQADNLDKLLSGTMVYNNPEVAIQQEHQR